ncbi:uncharacterized protein LOC142167215 [Nicotiana tabacum]|uniref:Uncharacterized protein LOC142167215 n=1 Tax=Nicotiana tabacum TaxID=4097 RepID=A0AC58SEV9_TOBAC
MNAIIWNIRSVNTKKAFERLVTMYRQHHFRFVGLMEPMQQSRKLERYIRRIEFAQAFVNISNKIWAFIDDEYEVTILFDMPQQLTLKLIDTNSHKELILTLVYAKCDHIERIELWDTLYALASDMTTPWIVGGYFNGSIYTWWNGRTDEDCILKRLDRVFANMEFQCDPNYVVKENWCVDFATNPFILFNHKLKKLKRALSVWNKATYGDIFQKIARLEELVLIHEAQFELQPTLLNRERLHKVQAELIRYLAIEEEFWRQKSGMAWFKDGNRNTKFFHVQVNGRRRRLQLKRIQNNEGNWIEGNE